jgi:hypothetical protein
MARAQLARLSAGIAFLLLVAATPAHALITLKPPSWAGLTAEQQAVLAPLAADWDAMEAQRQRKWIGIAQRYSGMTPDEKARVQERMREWARLSPAERRTARDSFSSLQKAPAEKRIEMKDSIRQQWQAYQELPEAEKERLRSEKLRSNPPPSGRSSVSATVPRGEPLPASTR